MKSLSGKRPQLHATRLVANALSSLIAFAGLMVFAHGLNTGRREPEMLQWDVGIGLALVALGSIARYLAGKGLCKR